VTDRAHLAFALALHRVAAADRSANACWSPYSVASALGLAAEAARGETRAELVKLLGEGDADLLRKAIVSDDAEFSVANTLWVWDQLEINPDFLTELGGWPGGKVRTAPFAEDPEAARKEINADVAETTHDLIPELLPQGAISPDTVASLVNALYLKSAWISDFPRTATESKPFHAPGGDVDVVTMHKTGKLGYAAQGGWQAVSLPARGGVEAVVLLPDGDLAEAEEDLDADRLASLLEATEFTRVALALPKIDVRVQTPLKNSLVCLGVRSMFTRDADLSGLSPDPELVVDEVLHEAVLRVDEEGFEGAAATAVTFRLVSMEIETEPVEVRVDRPYLLLVRHVQTGAIYFLTRVTRP
jgi:serine protease inhibitor